MSNGRSFTDDERVVLEMIASDACGFVDIAFEVGSVERAQEVVRALVEEGYGEVERWERWADLGGKPIPHSEVPGAIADRSNWLPREDPELPWYELAPTATTERAAYPRPA